MRSPLVKHTDQFALVRDGFKLIYTPSASRYELFDLRSDPGETRDLSAAPQHSTLRATLADEIERLLAEDRSAARSTQASPELSEEERHKLEALGYTD